MRKTHEPDETLHLDDPSPDDARAASLPPQPAEDVFARATRPVGVDVFARATMPTPIAMGGDPPYPPAQPVAASPRDLHLRPTVPGHAAPNLRPTVPGEYPEAAGEAALRDAHARQTAVEVRRAPSERPPRATEPIGTAFTPAPPLPFNRAAEVSRTSLTPVSTSGSQPRLSISAASAAPSASPRRPHIAVLAVGVAIAIGCAAALIGRTLHRPEANAAPPPKVATAPAAATPAAPEPAEAAPSATATPAATAAAPEPRAKPKAAAPAAPKPASTAGPSRAPHRPFDVESD